jgi:hypothetical protein
VIIQWAKDSEIEDIVTDIMLEDEENILRLLNNEFHVKDVFDTAIANIENIREVLKRKTTERGLKGNYLAYEEIHSVFSVLPKCKSKVFDILECIRKIVVLREIPAGYIA